MVTDHRAVYIKWVDSANLFSDHWALYGDLTEHEEETYCETLGWLVKENDHSLYVAGSVAPEEIGSVMQIPRVSVKELKEIARGEVERGSEKEAAESEVRRPQSFVPRPGQGPRCECESACVPGCQLWTNVERAGSED